MGEKMNRINTASLTLTGIATIFALATACSSGGDDPDGDNGKAGSSSNGGSAGSGTAGNGTAGSDASGGSGGSGTAGSGATGGSGGTAGGGNGSPSVCDDATFALPVGEEYIDNFEDTVRFPGWYAFSDTDPPDEPQPERVAGGALDTGFSGHVTATGITASTMMGYGAGFGFGLVDPLRGSCVDLSAFDGISFWIKGTAGASDVLKFQIVSPATQPTNENPPGDCAPGTACAFKHPAKEITLTPDWSHVVINWTDLAPAAAFTGLVLGFNMITDGPAYDVNIDEVTFFVGDAPTGPVEPATGAGGAGN